ncbi:MAG: SDR family oxidoreductase [Candidatus Marinimicrobia bacterium]|nr:SDR family oxidoreductase [Candidatus Neomarinimicrobiota bacterium]
MPKNIFSLEGKTALVTGANRGIGLAIGKALVDAGADILAMSRSGKFDELQQYCEDQGKKCLGYTCDLSDRQAVKEFASMISGRDQNIDILVNNAGTILRKPAAEHPDEYWDQVVDVNLRSQFILSREIGKTMLERGKGKIVFIASLLSFQGGITVSSYAASKGGIKSLTMALSNEWAGRGVNVNAVAPGYIATDNTSALQADPVRNKAILERIPAGRWGKPEDIAGTVVFLSSPASDYINGTTILVDGGWMGR